MSAQAWTLWGRMADGTPIRIMGGTLAEVRKERAYRVPLELTGGWTDLRIRKEGEPYEARKVTRDNTHDPNHPSWEARY